MAHNRPIHEIAIEVCTVWSPVHYSAQPYLSAMTRLDKITDNYGHDTASGIVLRFLGNAKSWRGDDARRIKAELRSLL